MKPNNEVSETELAVITANKKVYSYMGLAARAGKLASGEFSTEKSVKSGLAHLVIIAEDASDNTKKMFRNMCTYYNVDLYLFGDKEELGHAVGKEIRASLAFLDKGLADATCKQLKIATKSGGSENGKNENT